MPQIQFGIIVGIFVVIPLLVVINTLVQIGEINRSVWKSSLWLYFCTSIAVIIWIPLQVMKIVIAAKGYVEAL
jgi:hypothetical protein